MPATLVFDVNETLLDLRSLDANFESIFGNADIKKWNGLHSYCMLRWLHQ